MTDETKPEPESSLFAKNSICFAVSRGEQLIYGHVQATPEENAAYHADQERWWAEDVETWEVYDAAREALAELTDPLEREILALHSTETAEAPKCRGCDYGRWEAEATSWPCSTVGLIAVRNGIPLPSAHDLSSRPPAVMPEPHDYPTEPWSVRDLFPQSFVTLDPIVFAGGES